MQFKDAVYKIRYTIDEMQAMTGLGNKVSMQDFDIIEDKVQITHGKKKALKEPIRIGIVVFDMRLNLRRLPPYNSRDDAKTKVYIAVHNRACVQLQELGAGPQHHLALLEDGGFWEGG